MTSARLQNILPNKRNIESFGISGLRKTGKNYISSLKEQNLTNSKLFERQLNHFYLKNVDMNTAQKYEHYTRKLRIWSHLLNKSLMENFIFLCSGRHGKPDGKQ